MSLAGKHAIKVESREDLCPNFQRRLQFERLQELFRMALIRAREGDVRAARTAVRILEKQARLFRLDFDRRRKPPS
jgi:hypothetical protein